MQSAQLGEILHQQQIKQIIRRLSQISIRDYASTIWFKQDQSLQKLNMQLHVNAIMKNDEYILEQCIVQDKFKVLIYDLIMTNVWKTKVLPLLKSEAQKLNSLKIYLAIYHEAVVCNMMQVLMFHRTAIDESGDYLIEIIDYGYQKLAHQIKICYKKRKSQREKKQNPKPQPQLSQEQQKKKKIEEILKRSPVEELERQVQQIEFNLFSMSVSIIRYITDYVQHLQIGIIHHLITQCNIFSLLVSLIEQRPWLRNNSKGQRQIFENNRWSLVSKAQMGKLPKIEAQVWIAIYNLYMDPQCRKKYQLNDQRKNMLLRLRKFMNEVLLDQIPNLSYMLRSLQQLSMMNVPTNLSQNPFVVQQVPQMTTAISNGQDWQQLAKQQLIKLKENMDQTERGHLQRLAQLYSNNNVEGLLQGFKCGKCKKQAFKRCSKCKSVWYCSRQCQVADWPQHKVKCAEKIKADKEAQQERKKQSQSQQTVKKPVVIDELD